ncbi:hypothetical protein Tco_0820695 [Tanacetum coccineum]|uniref:Copia protein n=1 Tax=Tanacetum coccineum TaxID=301880 RepID=A0ABQ5AA58_9ASTR
MKVEESLNVTFDESPPPTNLSPLVDDDVGEEEAIRKNTKIVNTNNEEDESIEVDKIINIKESKNHPLDQKQTVLAISTTEAEYVSAGKACQQALWMKQALIDYGIRLDDVPIMCDNKGAIDLSKNPVQHSRTKHIEICHHFLRDNIQKGNISIEKVASEDNIADIFTKPLKRDVFNYLRLGLGMMELVMDSDPSSSQK